MWIAPIVAALRQRDGTTALLKRWSNPFFSINFSHYLYIIAIFPTSHS